MRRVCFRIRESRTCGHELCNLSTQAASGGSWRSPVPSGREVAPGRLEVFYSGHVWVLAVEHLGCLLDAPPVPVRVPNVVPEMEPPAPCGGGAVALESALPTEILPVTPLWRDAHKFVDVDFASFLDMVGAIASAIRITALTTRVIQLTFFRLVPVIHGRTWPGNAIPNCVGVPSGSLENLFVMRPITELIATDVVPVPVPLENVFPSSAIMPATLPACGLTVVEGTQNAEVHALIQKRLRGPDAYLKTPEPRDAEPPLARLATEPTILDDFVVQIPHCSA
mmetsp:Transcript_117922/g.333531  ORF Transcript_117922/g.333531 Transcript_117922/m.333531 type:complete len:281 (+) Transcript_117922:112-954(+)